MNYKDVDLKNHECIAKFLQDTQNSECDISGSVKATIAQFLMNFRIEINKRASALGQNWLSPIDIIDSQVCELRRCVIDLEAYKERLKKRSNSTMNQQRTIMGALDYSIASLKNIKTTLMDLGHTQKELNWAVGGIIITLTSQLIRVCQDTFVEAAQTDEANAKQDMINIQARFNDFMKRMINGE